MQYSGRVLAPALFALMLMATASAGAATPGMSGGRQAMGSAASSEMMAGMAKMNQAMNNAPMTGDADRDFVAMMLPHHQGAIDMARTELRYGKDPELRRLAKAVVDAQDKEIAEMKHWRAAHPAP